MLGEAGLNTTITNCSGHIDLSEYYKDKNAFLHPKANAIIRLLFETLESQSMRRVKHKIGGPPGLCDDDVSLLVCLETVQDDAFSLLHLNVSSYFPWPFTRSTVNAVYSQIDDTVYIPSGLVQKPLVFYNDPIATLVTLGYIIAHEVGHSLPISDNDASCLLKVESGLMNKHGYNVSTAVNVSNMTLDENYADIYSIHVIGQALVTVLNRKTNYISKFSDILSTFNKKPESSTFLLQSSTVSGTLIKNYFQIMFQTFCSSDPKSRGSSDPHQSPFFRVETMASFSSEYRKVSKCPNVQNCNFF